jgi:hypothetical protein
MIKSAAIEAKRYYEGINMEMEQIPCLAASQRQHEIGKVGASHIFSMVIHLLNLQSAP